MKISEHLIFPGVYYHPKLDHRNGSPKKSQWTIPVKIECNCFSQAYSLWKCPEHICWGLHFSDNKVDYLGESKKTAESTRKLFIAKFIDSNKNRKWHGYPADHIANHHDIPPVTVLEMWLKAKHLRAATIRKISKGQKCKL
jgi:hypothetical protein